MEFQEIIEAVRNGGISAVVLVIWVFSYRSWQSSMESYRKDTAAERKEMEQVLKQYREDMLEQRRMYENNVKLCENYMSLAKNQQDTLIMNTQALQKLCDGISTNQFCPMVRLKKITQEPQG